MPCVCANALYNDVYALVVYTRNVIVIITIRRGAVVIIRTTLPSHPQCVVVCCSVARQLLCCSVFQYVSVRVNASAAHGERSLRPPAP
mmetsp:Transcript_79557/g.128907  ORF Transcript_79557/g.128907 Transcript_79557/m.128907 type:complete len:88 (-) Transcript_79557:64-327(-)